MASPETDDALGLPEFTEPPRMLVVVAPFVRSIADMLLAGASDRIRNAGATSSTVEVPGSLEIPPAMRLAANSGRFDGYVALGCVIRGETTHYDTVCEESARGLMLLGLRGLCIGNGILTVENMQQAVARADPGQQDKGGEAAAAALHLVALSRKFGSPTGNVGFQLKDG